LQSLCLYLAKAYGLQPDCIAITTQSLCYCRARVMAVLKHSRHLPYFFQFRKE
jgi:hypothetical protein